MKAFLAHTLKLNKDNTVQVTGSKSESNRLLLLQALYPLLTIHNVSQSDDSQVLTKGLTIDQGTVDIHHAGTAMRFLTAYFASQEGKNIILTGSERMQQRPIAILVEALQSLGAEIDYLKNDGFPPLKISGKKLTKNHVEVMANVSSQYISALMLIAPTLTHGLKISLKGKVTSVPYIKMTLSLLHEIGVAANFANNLIEISPFKASKQREIVVESDWSSASYFYSIVALSENTSITIKSYKQNSLQGDSALARLYLRLGVQTEFLPAKNAIQLTRIPHVPLDINFDLSNTPDIAQTIAVTCLGLGKGCYLTGLHTLKIKETDRLLALKTELEKLGAHVAITHNSLRLFPLEKISEGIKISTYHDHRMAMAFAPLALKTSLIIDDCMVVTKSFPRFWSDMQKIGFDIVLD